MIPLVWACCTAWQTATNSSSRSRMLSRPDDAHAPLADRLQERVAVGDRRREPIGRRPSGEGGGGRARGRLDRLVQDTQRLLVGVDQALEPPAERDVTAAGLLQER